MLISVRLETGEKTYLEMDEYKELIERLKYYGIKYDTEIITDKMYKVTWHNPLTNEWKDAWCDTEKYILLIAKLTEAKLKYEVKEYN